MTSRRVEDAHVAALKRLLSQADIDCIRSRTESDVSTSILEESVKSKTTLEESETTEPEQVEEEASKVEDLSEEQSDVFPTPSLRHIIPERLRKLEELNRLNVLPENFNTEIDPAMIPKINKTAQQRYIEILGELVGCLNYKNSLAGYWFLDTLANLLRRAQEDCLDRPTQAVLILWFCEWMKEMQHFDAADRKRMLRRFRDNMLSAARFVAEKEHLPTPYDVDVYYKAPEEIKTKAVSTQMSATSKHFVTFKRAAYECSLMDLTKIIHYIFDLFSTDYQYNLVRSVFTFTPDYVRIDAPFQIQQPKRLYVPSKTKPKKEKSPKKDGKNLKTKGKKDVETEEFLALMELKAREERQLEEQEDREREEWALRSHILPLGLAADDKLFDKYWPPPPEPEPVPENLLDNKEKEKPAKSKGKGKKFSTDYQYNLVRSVFTFTPDYVRIDAPFQIQQPKRLYVPSKTKPKKEKSPKKDGKNLKTKGKKDVETEEFLALMELKAREERQLEEQKDREREEWALRSHILPLGLAADDKLFDKYWPPPPEPEPVPENLLDNKEKEKPAKSKGKGKK